MDLDLISMRPFTFRNVKRVGRFQLSIFPKKKLEKKTRIWYCTQLCLFKKSRQLKEEKIRKKERTERRKDHKSSQKLTERDDITKGAYDRPRLFQDQDVSIISKLHPPTRDPQGEHSSRTKGHPPHPSSFVPDPHQHPTGTGTEVEAEAGTP